jgi:hypothetical protein
VVFTRHDRTPHRADSGRGAGGAVEVGQPGRPATAGARRTGASSCSARGGGPFADGPLSPGSRHHDGPAPCRPGSGRCSATIPASALARSRVRREIPSARALSSSSERRTRPSRRATRRKAAARSCFVSSSAWVREGRWRCGRKRPPTAPGRSPADHQEPAGRPSMTACGPGCSSPRPAPCGRRRHIAGLPRDGLVFPAPEGGFLRASLFRRRTWPPAVARAGLAPLRPHDLRHTAVAFWIAAGATPKEVAARAGHTSVALCSTATDTFCRGPRSASPMPSRPWRRRRGPPRTPPSWPWIRGGPDAAVSPTCHAGHGAPARA